MKRKKQAKFLFVIYTIILFVFIIAIAAAVDDIEDIFNVVGAIAANAINFIFPAMFYMFLIRKKNKPKKMQYSISVGLFCFFIPFGILSVVSKFLKH
jgi:amino acid permease